MMMLKEVLMLTLVMIAGACGPTSTNMFGNPRL
jgi:hypothetical protein